MDICAEEQYVRSEVMKLFCRFSFFLGFMQHKKSSDKKRQLEVIVSDSAHFNLCSAFDFVLHRSFHKLAFTLNQFLGVKDGLSLCTSL